MKKKLLSLLLVIFILVALTACSSETTSSESSNTSNAQNSSSSIPQVTKSPEIPKVDNTPIALADTGALGNYEVQIGDFQISTDYEGNPVIVVDFTFTNNSEENASAIIAFAYSAYQNGVQLDSAIVMDSDIYDANDLLKEIQPGATLTVSVPFVLTSESAPVEFELSESFSFTDEMLGKIYEISDNGITELSVAPNADTGENLGDYAISIVSYDLVKDYEGKPAILINLGFTNNGNTTTNFLTSLNCKAFQDGIQLETAILTEYEAGQSQMRNIRPGAGVPVCVAYLLSSDTSPVQFEIEEFFSFSSNKISAEIDISK